MTNYRSILLKISIFSGVLLYAELAYPADGRFGLINICYRLITQILAQSQTEDRGSADFTYLRRIYEGINFSDKENSAVKAYLGFTYENINSALRSGNFDVLEKYDQKWMIPALDSALAKCPQFVGSPLILFRGEGYKRTRPLGNVDDIIEFPSYISTTMSFESAESFSYREYAKAGFDAAVIFEFRFPKDSFINGLYVPAVDVQTENEMLLPRGLRFRVLSSTLTNPGESLIGKVQRYYQVLEMVN